MPGTPRRKGIRLRVGERPSGMTSRGSCSRAFAKKSRVMGEIVLLMRMHQILKMLKRKTSVDEEIL
jgi:hypothetical protein